MLKKFLFGIFCFMLMFFLESSFKCSATVDFDISTIITANDFAEKNGLDKSETIDMICSAATLANTSYKEANGSEIYIDIINLAVKEWLSNVDISEMKEDMLKFKEDLSGYILLYNEKKVEDFFKRFTVCLKKRFLTRYRADFCSEISEFESYYKQCGLDVLRLSDEELERRIAECFYKFILDDRNRKILLSEFLDDPDDFDVLDVNLNEEDFLILCFFAAAPTEWYNWKEVDFKRVGFDKAKSITENIKLKLKEGIESLKGSKALVSLPKGNSLVVGDLHGNILATRVYIDKAIEALDKGYAQSVVFLGDYVDRGFFSMEVIIEVLNFKLKYPDKVFLLRGNHETENAGFSTFALELSARFSDVDSKEIRKLLYDEFFSQLPLAAEFNFDNGEKAICAHGGIPKATDENELLFRSYRFVDANSVDILEDEKKVDSVYKCLLWSDPRKYVKNQMYRGQGIIFSGAELDKFLSDLGYKFLVRGHEMIFAGLKESFYGKCYTVFSSHGYSDGNFGTMALVSQLGVKRYWVISSSLWNMIDPASRQMLRMLAEEKEEGEEVE